MDENRIYGDVKWFREDKGYGFIKGQDGYDYFCHYSDFPDGHTHGLGIDIGTRVCFERVIQENGKRRAAKIQLVTEG